MVQLIPYMFHGIAFRCVGRQRQQAHVCGRLEIAAGMPACPIKQHDDDVLRMACGDLIEKDLLASGIDVRQDQGVKYASERLYGGICVGVLVGQHGLA